MGPHQAALPSEPAFPSLAGTALCQGPRRPSLDPPPSGPRLHTEGGTQIAAPKALFRRPRPSPERQDSACKGPRP